MAIRVAAVILMISVILAFRAFADECTSCHAPTGTMTTRSPQWNQATRMEAFALTADASYTCMTCHDGTSARAVLHDGNHPVGIDYDRLQTQGWTRLHPSASPSGLGGTIADDLLVRGRVECTSCHDQHAAHGAGTTRLRMNNDGSRLCLTCHDR
jgi:predicted CXXCH cytochrome family protein